MKNSKLIVAMVALFCVSQAEAMKLNPKKKFGDYKASEMYMVLQLPEVAQYYVPANEYIKVGSYFRDHPVWGEDEKEAASAGFRCPMYISRTIENLQRSFRDETIESFVSKGLAQELWGEKRQ